MDTPETTDRLSVEFVIDTSNRERFTRDPERSNKVKSLGRKREDYVGLRFTHSIRNIVVIPLEEFNSDEHKRRRRDSGDRKWSLDAEDRWPDQWAAFTQSDEYRRFAETRRVSDVREKYNIHEEDTGHQPTPLTELKGVGSKVAKALNAYGVDSIEELAVADMADFTKVGIYSGDFLKKQARSWLVDKGEVVGAR